MFEDRFARYARQVVFPGIGLAGQRALMEARVTVIGCGATGSVLANHMARAGVGRLRLVDRDFVELSNLQRQMLYDEADVAEMMPKAVAAARKLRAVNSSIEIEPVVADVSPANVEALIADAGVVLDGTDNFATRYLLNDACIKLDKPWIYSGVVASYGMSMTIRPGVTPCLRCALGELPAPGSAPTCETAGVLGPAVALVGSIAAAEAIKLLVGNGELNTGMIHFDLWDLSFDRFDLGGPRPDCPACGQRTFSFLRSEAGARATVLCGRDAVQVSVAGAPALDLNGLAGSLQAAGATGIKATPYLIRATIDGHELTVFPDGRAIVKGAADEAQAATLYSRYIGM